ncbi:MAG: T9SS type A sorting domain-containing protein, partial [Bacteroidota bacterium]
NEYYTVREDLIWRGRANVLDGQFEATFVVPKDISYRNESGRISAYAAHPNGQALGFTENVVVGGTAQGFGDDDEGPEIRLFLNDTTFVSGEMTGPNPRLIVQLFDESGINTVGAGVGHEILLTFNDNDQDFVDLNRFYESEADSYQRGRIEYRIEHDLNSGMNSLSVRAWDVANNSSTERLDFFVGESETLTLRDVFNYPNPTSGRTRFVFQHNQPSGTPARVQVRIYSLSGRPIRTIRTEEALPSGIFTSGTIQIPWDGRDDDLGLLASGVYFYRLRVEIEGADGDRQVSEHIDRIAIIR